MFLLSFLPELRQREENNQAHQQEYEQRQQQWSEHRRIEEERQARIEEELAVKYRQQEEELRRRQEENRQFMQVRSRDVSYRGLSRMISSYTAFYEENSSLFFRIIYFGGSLDF